MVSTLEQMQVPNGTGPGVRRSERPLLASRTRCNVLWKPPKFCNKVKIGNTVQFGTRVFRNLKMEIQINTMLFCVGCFCHIGHGLLKLSLILYNSEKKVCEQVL